MKKGFTLIELLAVIVILAIIALIATPIVLDIIEDSKTNSIKRSSELYIDGVEQAVARYQLNGETLSNGTYYIMENGNLCSSEITDNKCIETEIKVTVEGNKPTSGSIVITDGQVQTYRNLKMDNNTYVTKDKNGLNLLQDFKPLCKAVNESTKGNIPDGNFNYGDEYVCDLGDGEERRFYVIDKYNNNISLILDKNIINSVAWCSKEDYINAGGDYLPNEGKTCEEMNTYCSTNKYGPITALKYLYDQTKDWINLSRTQIILPDAYKIAIAAGTTFDGATDISSASWLIGSYWTSTIPNVGDSAIAVVESTKKIMFPNPDEASIIGIRPVIVISKLDIK